MNKLIFKNILRTMVRMLAVTNIVVLVYERWSSTFYQSLRAMHIDDIVFFWFVVSSLLFPLYAGIELTLPPKSLTEITASQERRAILIDALLSFAWFFAWWGAVLYALTHRAIL